jgi:hypothetical protein
VAFEGEAEESAEGSSDAAEVQIDMQAKWTGVFAIVFGVMIWAATVALLQVCIFIFWFWKMWGFAGWWEMTRQVRQRLCFV